MDSGLIGKINKAKRYAEDRKRFMFKKFEVTFRGDNSIHEVAFDNGVFRCDCEFFQSHRRCGHSMALEILLGEMIPETIEK